MSRIKQITLETATDMLFHNSPKRGKFYVIQGSKFIAVDNTDGKVKTRVTHNKKACFDFLAGKVIEPTEAEKENNRWTS